MNDRELKLAIANATDDKDIEQIRGQMISEYINARYPRPEMDAIINNYLDDSTNPKYVQEFKTMQEYRRNCKLKVNNMFEKALYALKQNRN